MGFGMNIFAFVLFILAVGCWLINAWGYDTRVRLVSLGLALFGTGWILQLVLSSHSVIAH